MLSHPNVQLLKIFSPYNGDVYVSEVSEIVSVISSDQNKEIQFRHLKNISKTFEKDL